MTARSSRAALDALRVTAALLLLAHGVCRIVFGGVDDFGVFLTGLGLPFGNLCAWAVTGFEILGSLTLAAGRSIRLLALLFAAELTTGILLVHAQEGWFVVGLGRGGMEYSVLLIAVLLAVAYAGKPGR